MKTNLQQRPLLSTSGSYTGDDSANKPIAHGLGRVPKFIIVTQGNAYLWFTSNENSDVLVRVGTAGYSVTAMTSTNFYVGEGAPFTNSANGVGVTYYWNAIG